MSAVTVSRQHATCTVSAQAAATDASDQDFITCSGFQIRKISQFAPIDFSFHFPKSEPANLAKVDALREDAWFRPLRRFFGSDGKEDGVMTDLM